jgi:hypothetical protein
MKQLLVHVPHMNQVFQQSELGSHVRNPEEFQEPTVSEGNDCTQVIPDNNIVFLMFSFLTLQHYDDQTPAQEPGEKGQQLFQNLAHFLLSKNQI